MFNRLREWSLLMSHIADIDTDVWTLCRDMDNLSLNDDASSSMASSSRTNVVSSYESRSTILSYYRRLTGSSVWFNALQQQLDVPFMDVPSSVISESLLSSNNINIRDFPYNTLKMGFGFRYIPGSSQINLQDYEFPDMTEKWTFLRDSMGLATCTAPTMTVDRLSSILQSDIVMTSMIPYGDLAKCVVEVLSDFDGMYWRFIVLVCYGVVTTVWFGKVDKDAYVPQEGAFQAIHDYNAFYDSSYNCAFFRKLCFYHREYREHLGEIVNSSFESVAPFAEIVIPSSSDTPGKIIKSVGLGLMISFFLTVGVIPDSSLSHFT